MVFSHLALTNTGTMWIQPHVSEVGVCNSSILQDQKLTSNAHVRWTCVPVGRLRGAGCSVSIPRALILGSNSPHNRISNAVNVYVGMPSARFAICDRFTLEEFLFGGILHMYF